MSGNIKRVLVYTHNSIGLGHAFRTLAVITGMRKWRPDIDFLIYPLRLFFLDCDSYFNDKDVFVEAACNGCGGRARRDVHTLGQKQVTGQQVGTRHDEFRPGKR